MDPMEESFRGHNEIPARDPMSIHNIALLSMILTVGHVSPREYSCSQKQIVVGYTPWRYSVVARYRFWVYILDYSLQISTVFWNIADKGLQENDFIQPLTASGDSSTQQSHQALIQSTVPEALS